MKSCKILNADCKTTAFMSNPAALFFTGKRLGYNRKCYGRHREAERVSSFGFFVDSDKLSEKALEHKHKLETDPSCRTNHMEYMEGMEQINSDVMDKVLSQMNSYDYDKYTAVDVRRALNSETCNIEDFKALL